MTPEIFFETERGKLYLGDCLDLAQVVEAGSIDALVTDPPYSSGGQFRTDRMQKTSSKYQMTGTVLQRPEFQGDNKDQRSYLTWSCMWLQQVYTLLKDQGVICIFTDWRQLPILSDAIQVAGFVWRGIAVWDKTEAARPSKGRFRQQCEFILWGTKGSGALTGSCLPGVWRKAVNAKHKYHITGKPVEVMEGILGIVPAGGIVLDPFVGGGTTAVACEGLGYPWVCMDMDITWCVVTAQRLLDIKKG